MKLPARKLPSVAAVKTTLHTAVSKPSLATVVPVLAGVAMLTPVGAVAGATVLAVQHKDEIKSSLGHAATTVKNGGKTAVSTVEKVAVKTGTVVAHGAKSVASGMQNFMFMAMGVGGIVVLMMILKR